MNATTGTRAAQYLVRIAVLIFITYAAVMHQLQGVLAAPNAHVFCPFGGLESLYKLLTAGGYVQKIFPATLALLGGSVLLAILLNRAFCGWICPLGTLQMLCDRLARALKIRKLTVPATAEKVLSGVKYAILAASLYFTWTAGSLVYAYYDPWAAYAHLAAGVEEVYAEFLVGAIFLIAALLGSFWLPQNFCRYFCPMGAFLSMFSKCSPTKIHRNATSCIRCKKCDAVCPAQIEIAANSAVTSAQCLSCGDCLNVCPVENTLAYHVTPNKPVSWLMYGLAALLVFFAPVGIAKLTGIWQTNFATATDVVTDESGAKNPSLIKGSMTLESVAQEFRVPAEKLLAHFKLPADTDPKKMLKDIAHANNLEVSDFREFIAQELQARQPGGAEEHETNATDKDETSK